MSFYFPILLLLTFAIFAESGSVGKCRTECVEKNRAKIVRVHLKDDLVMAGLCSNNTADALTVSTVTPYICNRNVGIWMFDETDEEGKAPFNVLCPTPEQYPLDLMLTCPIDYNENRDDALLSIIDRDYEGSGANNFQ